MTEHGKLRYPQPLLADVGILLAGPAAFALISIWRGRWILAAAQFVAFFSIGLVARHFRKNEVSRQGFSRGGVVSYDWADVSQAHLRGAQLELECRNAGRVTIPANVVRDSAFLSAIGEWLADEHPVRIALDRAASSAEG